MALALNGRGVRGYFWARKSQRAKIEKSAKSPGRLTYSQSSGKPLKRLWLPFLAEHLAEARC